jgi:hypothetical protein
MYLGYDLDGIRLLRYRFTGEYAVGSQPEVSWEVVLTIEKIADGRYFVTRASTNSTFGGFNATFTLDHGGGLNNVMVAEMTTGYENTVTGEWVKMTISDEINGTGYYQEIVPLPDKTVSLGDSWNGTFDYKRISQLKGQTIDTSIMTAGSGSLFLQAVHRKEVETPAGKFSVAEVESEGETTGEMHSIANNETVNTGNLVIPHKSTHMVEIETGIVVHTIDTIEEAGSELSRTVAELVEIVRS